MRRRVQVEQEWPPDPFSMLDLETFWGHGPDPHPIGGGRRSFPSSPPPDWTVEDRRLDWRAHGAEFEAEYGDDSWARRTWGPPKGA